MHINLVNLHTNNNLMRKLSLFIYLTNEEIEESCRRLIHSSQIYYMIESKFQTQAIWPRGCAHSDTLADWRAEEVDLLLNIVRWSVYRRCRREVYQGICNIRSEAHNWIGVEIMYL